MYISAIGQDSHRFEEVKTARKLILGGVVIPDQMALVGNSDADVILHAVTNAVSGLTGVNVLGEIADKLCIEAGITDSRVYLKDALESLGKLKINHLSVSIECKRPKIAPHINSIKKSLADLLSIDMSAVGITATTGENLTDFGKGLGIQVFAIISAEK